MIHFLEKEQKPDADLGDSTDRWEQFYTQYTASDAIGKWKNWCLLTKPQQEYFSKRFQIEPPPPARSRHS